MQLTQPLYQNENFAQQQLDGPELTRLRFEHCTFRWTDFTDLDEVFQCTFDSCDFSNARLNGVRFQGCAFLSCSFAGASFFAVTLEECKLTGSDFRSSECPLAVIRGGDWSYTVLRGLSFHKQDLHGVCFWGADLSECVFNECDLTGCEFSEATAKETSFYRSDLRGSVLESFPLQEASFRGAKLDLTQCVLLAETLTGARYLPQIDGAD